MKLSFLLCLLLFAGFNTKAQTTEDSVKAAITQLFNAMKNSDSASLVSAFTKNAVLQAIGKDAEGLVAKNESVKDFAVSIGRATKGSLDERISFQTIKIDGPLASVWTPYSFYYNGAFSHCGVNSFQLLRTAAGWKIHYLIDTRRKAGCENK